MRTPEGAKSATPYEQVATDGNPPTTEKFSTVVRVKATQKTNASIDVVILDPRGDTLMEAGREIEKIGSVGRALAHVEIRYANGKTAYADAEGRMRISKAFNDAIASGELAGPVVLGRDHHDVSGTDSPFRETTITTRLRRRRPACSNGTLRPGKPACASTTLLTRSLAASGRSG